MEGFTIVDAGVLVVVLMSAILAYSRGLVREMFAIMGWVAAAVLGFMFARQAAPLVKQIPVLDKFLGDNCELSTLAGFFAVFAGALILASILTPLFSSIIQRSALSGVDQGLGFLFGVARGVILVAVALVLYNRLLSDTAVPAVDKSRSAAVFASLEAKLGSQIPTDAPGWIAGRYKELVGSCTTTAATTTTAPAPATDSQTGGTTGTNSAGAKTVTP
ncbi:MAG: CvpA family protein [Proteobacteria bacterium]|nr:CvpA family protein [Pseudomonadota bacterium]MBS0573932.1 CvpA family protein [Pseudomonadota bacterium]